MDDSRVKTAAELISSLISPQTAQAAERWFEFGTAWKRAAGEREGAHSHVVDARNGILVVEVEHPGWIQLLQMKQSAILDKLARRFPDLGLKAIAFRLAADPKPADGGESMAVPVKPVFRSDGDERPENPDKAEGFTVEAVRDDALKSALTSLAAAFEDEKGGGKPDDSIDQDRS
ncbi:MAG: DUF721 domain-containing protein [Spirochaetes bacterium]|nr:DUF721 domain-containing protein [Spirochaetota bacterium]